MVGLAPTRRARLNLIPLGLLAGLPMILGTLLANVPVVAVLALGVLGPLAAMAGARSKPGMLVMTISLPMVAVGLSYTELSDVIGLSSLIIGGSAYAALLSLLWPERAAVQEAAHQATKPDLNYGLRLGAAGALAAAIGFALDLQHVGWACAAALLVMRPAADMLRLRGAGRILSVATGSILAIGLVLLDPRNVGYAVAALIVVTLAAATNRSRWYLTAGFTTFMVFVLLLQSDPSQSGFRFEERLIETAAGVGIAYLFGVLLAPGAKRP